MKKLVAVILCFVLTFSLFPISTYATETNESDYNRLINLACSVFPEYSSLILNKNPNSNRSSVSSTDELIHTETRHISDTEALSISVYSSGNVIIIDTNYSYVEIEVSSSNMNSIGNVGVSGTATFEVTVTARPNEYFKLSGVGFTIYYTGSDYFTNTGICSMSSNVYTSGTTTITSTLIQYPIVFVSQPTAYCFRLYFDNDKLYAVA